MSDKIISELTEKTSLADADLIVVEGVGVTWRAKLSAFREYFFSLITLISGARPDREDSVIIQQFNNAGVRRIPLKNLLPVGVVVNDMLAVCDEVAGTGITSDKIAPSAIINSKLAVESVHTHNLAEAEIANEDNYPSKDFGSGITESKITDGAVTGIKGGVPPGAVFHFAALKAPGGYLVCNGDVIGTNLEGFTQEVENWRLASLRILLGSTYGGSGKLPDLRGIFVRGYGGSQESVGSNSKALYRDEIFAGIITTSDGWVNLGDSDPNYLVATDHWVVEVFARNSVGGDAIYCQLVNTYTVGKSFTPRYLFTTGYKGSLNSPFPYKVYAMRYLKSGPFGEYQESSYMRHYHPTYDIGHTHANTVSFTLGAHDHGFTLPVQAITGASRTDGPGCNVLSTSGSATSQQWTQKMNIPTAPTVSIANVNASALSRGMNSYTGGDMFNQSASIARSGIVDENRPHNIALLPCIKY